MTLCLLLTIIFLALFIVSLVAYFLLNEWEYFIISLFPLALCVIFGLITVFQPLILKNEMLTQYKERQQIIYQIENLKEDTDKVALNERILTYNSWINEINLSKELYGWASWYYSVDMSKHTIILLQ